MDQNTKKCVKRIEVKSKLALMRCRHEKCLKTTIKASDKNNKSSSPRINGRFTSAIEIMRKTSRDKTKSREYMRN